MIIMSFNIELEKEDYFPGETVKGTLSVTLEKVIKARKVEVTLEGTESLIDGSSERRSIPVPVTSAIAWASSKAESLGPGTKTYPFELALPETLRPSRSVSFDYTIPAHAAENGITSTIPSSMNLAMQYHLKAKIDVPRAIDPKANILLQVNPLSKKVSPMNIGSRLMIDEGNIYVEANVDKNIFTPGDKITGRVMVTKDLPERLRAIDVILKFVITGSPNKGAEPTKAMEQVCDFVSFPFSPDETHFESTFELESFPDGPISVYGDCFKIMWLVDVKVDLPLKVDQHVRIPLHALLQQECEPQPENEACEVEWIETSVPSSAESGDRESTTDIEELYQKFNI
jgi:sporulation-control protein spo0M